ncbi:hypothetical protein HK414_09870 [Ramlibacter terrae]|uniref:Class I SAM-dependent methyltransferase n=1 Tax=Ramlibacter terrae TaxID=2732511 RepID=A0ABX6P1V6_9BURK|nr:hypothetical protein HK414_09870 [Ramlibacter terrae]
MGPGAGGGVPQRERHAAVPAEPGEEDTGDLHRRITGALLYIPGRHGTFPPVRPPSRGTGAFGPRPPRDMRQLAKRLLNNFAINHLLILLGQDHLIKKRINNWRRARYDKNKTLQENVGFSRTPDVVAAVERVHAFVRSIDRDHLDASSKVLDIGCGVGLYLKDFRTEDLHGIDMSAEFLAQCKELVPTARTFWGITGDPPRTGFAGPGHFGRSGPVRAAFQDRSVFSQDLGRVEAGGLVAIQYPHALNWRDRFYDDLSYVSYTPERIEQALRGRFEVLSHLHAFDDRPVRGVDAKRYGEPGQRHFANGMLLLARKVNAPSGT